VSPAGVVNDPDGRVLKVDVWVGPVIYRAAVLVIRLNGDPDPAVVIVDPILWERLRDDTLRELPVDRLELVTA
jgi:hypothetical protein